MCIAIFLSLPPTHIKTRQRVVQGHNKSACSTLKKLLLLLLLDRILLRGCQYSIPHDVVAANCVTIQSMPGEPRFHSIAQLKSGLQPTSNFECGPKFSLYREFTAFFFARIGSARLARDKQRSFLLISVVRLSPSFF